MKRLVPFLIVAGLVSAADFWQTKPFTEWSDKDVNKMLTNSPWAHSVSVSLGGGMPGMGGGVGGRGDRATGDEVPGRPGGAPDLQPNPGLGAPGGNVGSNEPGVRGDVAVTPSVSVTVRWQSAMPVKQAAVRRKYGAEATTSPEAKQFLDSNATYLIAVSGLPPTAARALMAKASVVQQTTLSAKGKDPLRASELVPGPPGKQVEVFFIFQKTAPFTLDDKEVEFSTQIGTLSIKNKFRLKDMVVNGTLEL